MISWDEISMFFQLFVSLLSTTKLKRSGDSFYPLRSKVLIRKGSENYPLDVVS